MLWIVDYRTKDGARGRTEVEADNRAVVISLMREKGRQVVNIIDGPSVADARKRARTSSAGAGPGAWLKALLALAFFAATFLAVWYWVGGERVRSLMEEKVRPAGTVTISPAP